MTGVRDIESIRQEISKTVASLVGTVEEIEKRLTSGAAQIGDRFEKTTQTLRGIVEMVSPKHHIQAHPFLSVGLSLGVGVAVGNGGGRRRRRRRRDEEAGSVSQSGTGLLRGTLLGGAVFLAGQAGKEHFPSVAPQIESVQNALLARIAQRV